jgi:hypothetical protein
MDQVDRTVAKDVDVLLFDRAVGQLGGDFLPVLRLKLLVRTIFEDFLGLWYNYIAVVVIWVLVDL